MIQVPSLTGGLYLTYCLFSSLFLVLPEHTTPPEAPAAVVVVKPHNTVLSTGTQKVVDNVMSFLPEVRTAHALYPDVPVSVILTVIHIESGGEPTRVNKRSKAAGLMQIVPGPKGAYFKAYGLTETTALDPTHSINAGVKILHAHTRTSKKRWDGKLKFVLAAYCRGGGNVDASYPGLDATAQEYLKMYNAVAHLYTGVK